MSASTTWDIIFLVIGIWGLLFCFLAFKSKLEKRRLIKKYDEQKDKSKLGEENSRRLRGETNTNKIGRETYGRESSTSKFVGLGRQKEIQIPTPSSVGENSTSRRKSSSKSKGVFKLYRRR